MEEHGRSGFSVMAVVCGFSIILKSTIMNMWQEVTSSNQINTVRSNNTEGCCKTSYLSTKHLLT